MNRTTASLRCKTRAELERATNFLTASGVPWERCVASLELKLLPHVLLLETQRAALRLAEDRANLMAALRVIEQRAANYPMSPMAAKNAETARAAIERAMITV